MSLRRQSFGDTAQWQPWSAVKPDGSALWIALLRPLVRPPARPRAAMTSLLAKVASPAGTAPTITYSRLTTASMPNLLPSNNDVQGGFIGDYMWVTVDAAGTPYVVWSDTPRPERPASREDIYFSKGGLDR